MFNSSVSCFWVLLYCQQSRVFAPSAKTLTNMGIFRLPVRLPMWPWSVLYMIYEISSQFYSTLLCAKCLLQSFSFHLIALQTLAALLYEISLLFDIAGKKNLINLEFCLSYLSEFGMQFFASCKGVQWFLLIQIQGNQDDILDCSIQMNIDQ